MKSIVPILTGLYVAGSLLQAQETKIVNEAFLTSLRTEAARHHPAASAGKLRAAAAARDIRSVRLWDDPMVGLSLTAAEKSMRADDGDIRIGFEQPLPKPGLFQANLAKAEAMRKAELENSRASVLEVAAAAAKDAIELALADESITLQTRQIQWLNSMA